MAKQNGTAAFDVSTIVAESEARTSRLKELGKTLTQLQKEREKITADEAKLTEEIQSLMGGATVKASKPAKATKSDKSETKPRKRPANAFSLREVLLTVLPNSESDGIDRDTIAELVAKTGYKTSCADSKIVIGQALGKFNDFQNASRGMWRLSKFGERNLVKMNEAAAEADAAEAAEKAAAATPAPAVETAVAAA